MGLTLLLAIVIAFNNEEWRPYIYTTMMVFLAIFGSVNGYSTMRKLKFFGNTDWGYAVFVSAMVFPIMLTLCFAIELLMAWI